MKALTLLVLFVILTACQLKPNFTLFSSSAPERNGGTPVRKEDGEVSLPSPGDDGKADTISDDILHGAGLRRETEAEYNARLQEWLDGVTGRNQSTDNHK